MVYAVAAGFVGLLAGYIVGGQGVRAPAPVQATLPTPVATPLFDESELRGYREILARDPKNLAAAVKAGNLLYDAQRYTEAIGFYQHAFALNPRDATSAPISAPRYGTQAGPTRHWHSTTSHSQSTPAMRRRYSTSVSSGPTANTITLEQSRPGKPC